MEYNSLRYVYVVPSTWSSEVAMAPHIVELIVKTKKSSQAELWGNSRGSELSIISSSSGCTTARYRCDNGKYTDRRQGQWQLKVYTALRRFSRNWTAKIGSGRSKLVRNIVRVDAGINCKWRYPRPGLRETVTRIIPLQMKSSFAELFLCQLGSCVRDFRWTHSPPWKYPS